MAVDLSKLIAPDIFDVTIRDGSYVIDFQFESEDVRLLCRSLDQSGFRYIEVGHGLGLNASAVKDPAAASDEEYLTAAAESCAQARFGTFFIPGIGGYEHLRWARESFGMHFIRLGSEPDKCEKLLPYLEYAKGLGYEVMCNFMKSYCVSPAEIGRKAAMLTAAGADVVYIVDSAGGMLPDEVGDYCRAIKEHAAVRVGFHGHNNLELAVSNSISAWQNGATLIDCSVGGLGRSSGNTRTELFIPVLKALGATTPYDFNEVLRLWQEVIRPVMQRRSITAEEIVGGYARIHSGMMEPFQTAARRHNVDIVTLLDAYGDILHSTGQAPAAVDDLARQLHAEPAPRRIVPRESLLSYSPPTGPDSLRNTFSSFDGALQSIRVLAHKACLPVAALVDIAPSEEPYLAAEYLYHDDHFIVVRAVFGSVTSFVEAMQRHPTCFDVLVFDGRSQGVRPELMARELQWQRGQQVLWTDVAASKYHSLYMTLYQAVVERSARNVLFLGGDADRLKRFLPPVLDGVEMYCTLPDPQALSQVSIRQLGEFGRGSSSLPSQFDIVVVLAPINSAELQPLLSRVSLRGVMFDAVGIERGDQRLRMPEMRTLSLWKAMTGELLTLLPTLKTSSTPESADVAPLPFRTVRAA